MENAHSSKMGNPDIVNIPIQMLSLGDTNGRITPIRFRFQTGETMIETVMIEKTVSRDEVNYVGIREKQFICTAVINHERHIMEIRYNVGTQKWRIFQFLA